MKGYQDYDHVVFSPEHDEDISSCKTAKTCKRPFGYLLSVGLSLCSPLRPVCIPHLYVLTEGVANGVFRVMAMRNAVKSEVPMPLFLFYYFFCHSKDHLFPLY